MSFPNIIHTDDPSVYVNEATRSMPVGARVELPNGRMFRYALAGATALVSGQLQQCSAQCGHTNNDTLAVATDVAVGDTSVAITNGATPWTEDELKDGVVVNERVEELGAHCWRIGGNTAEAAGSAAMTITLTPGAKFDVALTAGTSVLMISPNLWSKVIVYASSGVPVGVATQVISIARYGLLQTHGVGAICFDDTTTPVIGEKMCPSTGTAGELDGATLDVNQPNIATTMSAQATNSDFSVAYLFID